MQAQVGTTDERHKSPAAGASAAEGVADRPAHLAHRVVVRGADEGGERRPSDRVKPVAVDHRTLIKSGLVLIDVDLGCEAADRCRDLRDGDEVANVDHLRSRPHQDGPCLAADLGRPDLASRQSSLQASASFQNGSGRSGRRSYAARSAWANAARTAAETPSRAAAEMLIPSCRARSARASSSVKVVRTEAILGC